MRVARIASAHEYVHHVVNMNLFFERQLPIHREGPGQIRVTAVVVFLPLQQQVGVAHGTGWPLVIDAFFVRAADDCVCHYDGPGTSRRDEREHFFGNVGIVADIGSL
jgi:hypothetical protein